MYVFYLQLCALLDTNQMEMAIVFQSQFILFAQLDMKVTEMDSAYWLLLQLKIHNQQHSKQLNNQLSFLQPQL